MSPGRRAEAVVPLSSHQWHLDENECTCGATPPPGAYGDELHDWLAGHQVDALVAAGFELFRPNDVVPSGP